MGPSYLITTTSPFFTFPSPIPLFAANSESKTIAEPLKTNPSFPVILATEPSSAIFPYNILICPELLIGFSIVLTTSWPILRSLTSFKFSSKVFPVTVRHSP